MTVGALRHVGDDERRARLALRHALAPAARRTSAEEVVRAVVALHATEAASVYLSYRARHVSPSAAELERALYGERTIVKTLAMRRTVFVVERDLLAATWASASARVARTEGARMAKDVVAAGLADDGERWLESARAEVLAVLAAHPDGLTALQLRTLVPAIAVKVRVSATAEWSGARVLVYLGARGDIARAVNAGDWRRSRPRWTLPEHWLGKTEPRPGAGEGYRELVDRWLHAFGPGTEDDIVWWLGATKTIVRAALAELGAVEVSLDGGRSGWLARDDLERHHDDPRPWVALLPVLDPTVMGWRERGFYLGEHAAQLFDRQGNGGTTAWVDGRIVGCWVQDDAGTVQVRLLEPVAPRPRRALDAEARRLTAWLDGARVTSVWRSPAMA